MSGYSLPPTERRVFSVQWIHWGYSSSVGQIFCSAFVHDSCSRTPGRQYILWSVSSSPVASAFHLLRSLPDWSSPGPAMPCQCRRSSSLVVNYVRFSRYVTRYIRVYSPISTVETLLSTPALCIGSWSSITKPRAGISSFKPNSVCSVAWRLKSSEDWNTYV